METPAAKLAEELEPSISQEEIAQSEEQPKVETPEPEVKEGEDATEPPKRPDKFVKIQALDEQKHKRRAAEAKAAEAERRAAVLEDRWNQLFSAQRQQQPQIPDASQDAVGHFNARVGNVEKTVGELAQVKAQIQAERQAAAQEQQFRVQVSSLEAEFSGDNPDYPEAVKFAKDKRFAELKAIYPPEVALQVLNQDAAQIAWAALQQGKNPAEAVYEIAQTMGYQPKAKQGQQKMEAMQKGVKASKTISGGSGESGYPTAEQIASMSDTDFAKLKQKLSKDGLSVSDIL